MNSTLWILGIATLPLYYLKSIVPVRGTWKWPGYHMNILVYCTVQVPSVGLQLNTQPILVQTSRVASYMYCTEYSVLSTIRVERSLCGFRISILLEYCRCHTVYASTTVTYVECRLLTSKACRRPEPAKDSST